MLKRSDIEQGGCACAECHQAGVSELLHPRSPQTGAFLHGYELARWYRAKEAFWEQARAAMQKRQWPTTTGRPGESSVRQRLEAIFANRQPGSDDE